ncbi:MAG TPA: hypothetical protein VKI44_15030 [Acetobacteraceae bacterium]|nr:hypothetical protein [Acetobacteraceae bacterium]
MTAADSPGKSRPGRQDCQPQILAASSSDLRHQACVSRSATEAITSCTIMAVNAAPRIVPAIAAAALAWVLSRLAPFAAHRVV